MTQNHSASEWQSILTILSLSIGTLNLAPEAIGQWNQSRIRLASSYPATPLNLFSLTVHTLNNTHITSPLHLTQIQAAFQVNASNSNILHNTINLFSSLHKHPSQSHREHTSLCPSKISRPSVSIFPQPLGAILSSPVMVQGTIWARGDLAWRIICVPLSFSSLSVWLGLQAFNTVEILTSTDPFAEADEDTGETKQSQNYIHIRIQRTFDSIQHLRQRRTNKDNVLTWYQ